VLQWFVPDVVGDVQTTIHQAEAIMHLFVEIHVAGDNGLQEEWLK
jgi:hypothetical protein